MKVIVSHDVDHLSVREHFGDLVLPKFVGLCGIELLKGNISFGTFKKRISGMWGEKAWNNLEELLEFDKEHGVESTFFVAVDNALGLNYDRRQAEEALGLIEGEGFDTGIHGIAYDDPEGIEREKGKFAEVSEKENFGVRLHYMRMADRTLELLDEAGYPYDSSVYSEDLKQPYAIEDMVEFPVHVEGVRLFSPFHHGFSLEEAKDYTEKKMKEVEEGVFNVSLHPRYFSEEFPRYREWYEWLITRVGNEDVDFKSYEGIKEEPTGEYIGAGQDG